MPHLGVGDRIKETTTTTGTGTIDLAGAVEGYQTFVAGIGNGHETYYSISNRDADEWEVGYGTITDAATDTLSRTVVISSSNGGSLVNFSAGTKDVICTLPADRSFVIDDEANVSVTANVTATAFDGSGAALTALNASNVSSGTLDNARLSAIPNSALENSAITINGTSTDLGGSINVGDIEGVTAGDGLTGGGTTGTVTLNVGAGTGIDVSADAVAVDVSDFMTNGANNRVVTATGTDAMNAEANMTFDGSTLAVTGGATLSGDLTVDTTTLHVDSTNNRVGIGTTSPSYPLHIADTAPILALEDTDVNTVFALNASSTSGIIQYQTDVTSVGTNPEHWFKAQGRLLAKIHDNADFSWYEDTGSSVKMFWDASTENLGIGTTSPNEKLQINATASSFVQLTNNDTGTSDNNGLYVGVVSGGDAYIGNRHIGDDIVFQNDNTEVMRIKTGGNVGIGTSSPNSNLDIRDTGANNGGTLTLGTTTATTGGDYGAIQFYKEDASGAGVGVTASITATDGASSGATSELVFATGDSGTANAERMRIDSSGNVGIGESNPDTPLHINGGTTNLVAKFESTDANAYISFEDNTTTGLTYIGGTADDLYFGTNGSEAMRIDSSGNVGIGTTSPAQKLTVASEGRLRLQRADNTRYGDIYNDNNFLNIETSNDPIKLDGQSYIRFDVNSSEAVRINSSGNVGINTTGPTSLLDINSSGPSTTPVRIDASTGSGSVVWVENSGSDFYQQIRDTSGTTKVQLNSDGVSYFSGGDVTIGATGGGHILTVNGTTVDDFPLKVTGTPTGSYLYQEITSQKATANSIGTAIEFRALSTTQERQTGVIVSEWTNNVDASRTSQYRFNTSSGGSSATPLTLTGADATFEGSVYLSSGSASLGIGTTSPQDYFSGADQLVIYDGSQAGITIRAGTTSIGRIHFADGTTGNEAYRGYIVYDHSDDEMLLGTSGSTRMVIESGGNVGIGTNSPNEKMQLNSSGSTFLQLTTTNTGTADDNGLYVGVTSGGVGYVGLRDTNGNPLIFQTENTERMRIDSSGNVGIGTSSPSQTLDVAGTILTDKAYIALATLTDGATISWDMADESVAKVTLGGNRTIAAPTNGSTGQFASITVIQDGTGSRTLTWNAVYEFKDDTAPTLTTTGGKGDLFVFQYNGTKWLEVGRNLNLTQS